MRRVGGALTFVGLLAACGEPTAENTPPRAHRPECQAPATVSNQPRSIDQTVELVNALPKPLTLPCFIEALGRPLALHATLSDLSAQPAVGARSPRLFVYFDPLVLSVAPAGIGAHLLELGEQRPGHRSLKAELAFPIEEQVTASSPYERVRFNDRVTSCAFCHAEEELDPAVLGVPGYVSRSLRPIDRHRVPLATLRDELSRCDADREPERCDMLGALFGWGDTTEWDFPPDMSTFGG